MTNDTDSTHPICKAPKANGEPCKATCLTGLDTCYWHSGLASAGQRRGGKVHTPNVDISAPDLSSPAKQREFLEQLIANLHNGRVSLNVAKISISAISVIHSLSDDELLRRIEALEQAHAAR